ncbi:MAG: carbamoyl-phosphate synthase large subunit [Deltaproteobacteria bacterium]|nr:carbamoyl-phosphate synthase large subunit [Deltaproteobacteria bacterium]
MPKRTDLKKIMLIGSGPIVIGQACEFDYSGTQACKALKAEGYEVVLINSNPATIMTDPEVADRTYIEPITPEVIQQIIEKERPQALLPTLGGQTALNQAVILAESGVLDRYQVELIGAKLPAIKKAEDRQLFKEAMKKIGLEVPTSGLAHSMKEAWKVLKTTGYPAIIRPAFTLGGSGGNIARNKKEFAEYAQWGIDCSPVRQILIEESALGWKEYELEVMRDGKDNVVIICSIENFDPMGIHTGDSITVAPAQTLTDKEYQIMRDAAIRIIREIGVDTGGSNIQFAIHPKTGRMVVIEMNPRVSRSSALASKATGFPIAKIATKLAVGYTLDEILNDITRSTPACFEPTIDYVVTKIPRFTFEKFPEAESTLTTQMKSVGEVMAIGRTFQESLQKGMRALETGSAGFENPPIPPLSKGGMMEFIRKKLKNPNSERLWYIGEAFRRRYSVQEIYRLTKIDPWFLNHIREIIRCERKLKRVGAYGDTPLQKRHLMDAKRAGFSDRRIAKLWDTTEEVVRKRRERGNIRPVYKRVDTCGAEFVAHTPYLYSTYETEDESDPTQKKKVVILGSGPNRIGQGIEFDYCCVQASIGLQEEGFETIMVNCNPETVSTDYDTSDRLYFEPLTFEDVMNILETERPDGVIVQMGGQTPLKLAVPLKKAGVKILGTSPESIDRAEDRKLFAALIHKLGLRQPENGTARSEEEAVEIARKLGFPVLVRPSYVLGGRGMAIAHIEEYLRKFMKKATEVTPEHPVLIDKFLSTAIEVDVDALCDGEQVVIAGIMEHIEEAGIHSGDSAACLPPFSLPPKMIAEITEATKLLARELKVIGLINIQFAIQKSQLYILEVNPRASRTVPFISKATGVPIARIASKLMVGRKLRDFDLKGLEEPDYFSVKESVFPFQKFPGVDTLLGPEMKSTGEVMGIGQDFGVAFAKSQIAAGNILPLQGKIFLSVKDSDKPLIGGIVKKLLRAGFSIVATRGTANYLRGADMPTEIINKVAEGSPHIVEALERGEITMVINTVEGRIPALDSFSIRRTTLMKGIPYFTTISAAMAAVDGILAMKEKGLTVRSIQEYHQRARTSVSSHKIYYVKSLH